MSSCVCKKFEGVVFPLLVEAIENGKDDAVDAFDIDKSHHGPGSPTHFDKAALNNIRRSDLFPKGFGCIEEVQQLG
jgi:hypothetical protein